MAVSDNQDHQDPNTPNLTRAQLRMLRIIVIFSSVFLVFGFVGMVSVIVYKLTSAGPGASEVRTEDADQMSVPRVSALEISKGDAIEAMSLYDNKIAVQMKNGDTQEILVLDLQSGKLLNRFKFNQK